MSGCEGASTRNPVRSTLVTLRRKSEEKGEEGRRSETVEGEGSERGKECIPIGRYHFSIWLNWVR